MHSHEIIPGVTYGLTTFDGERIPEPGNYARYYRIGGLESVVRQNVIPVVVRRVHSLTSQVEVPGRYVRVDSGWGNDEPNFHTEPVVLKVANVSLIEWTGGDTSDVTKPWRPYEVPEGMLDPLDERLTWFWDMVGEYANQRRFCAEYDTVVKRFGLPGRKQTFTVSIRIGDLSVTIPVQAHTQQEARVLAERKVAQEVSKFQPTEEVEDVQQESEAAR